MKSPPRATLTARTYASKQSSRSGDSRRCDLRLCTSATARATASTTRRDRPPSSSRPIDAARYTSQAQVTDRHHPPPQCRNLSGLILKAPRDYRARHKGLAVRRASSSVDRITEGT